MQQNINIYLPKQVSDYNYEKRQLCNQIIQWITNFKNEVNSSIILIGKHGVGKETIINTIAKTINYDVLKISNNNIKEFNFIDINNNNRIFNDKKYLILIDNIDNLTITDKKILTNLNIKNMKNKLFPIIYFNINHNKFLSCLKKISNIYYINYPSNFELYAYIENIFIKENILTKVNISINDIIQYIQQDYRKLNTILELIIQNNKNLDKSIDNIQFINFFNIISKKDTHIDLYKATKDILYNEDKSYDEIISLYNEDKVLLPSMIFQNVPNVIQLNIQKTIDNLINVYKALSYSDFINTSMFIYQNWELQEVYGHFSCIETQHNLKKIAKKKNEKIDFTIDLNRLSQKNVNKNTLRMIKNKLNIEQSDIKYVHILNQNLNLKYKTYINKFK